MMHERLLLSAPTLRRPGERYWPFGEYGFGFAILFTLIAVELVAATLVGQKLLGVPAREVFQIGDVTLGLSGWFIIPLVWLGLIAIALAKRRADHPSIKLFRMIRLNRDWLVRGFLLAIIHIPLGRAFGTFKSSIPLIHPFDWDVTFADLDHAIFGLDAWRLTHAVIGDFGTVVIDRLYALWGTYLILLAGWISFTRNRAMQIKAALTFNLCWLLLGTVLATTFASVGPCFFEAFYASDRFAPLMNNLAQVNERDPLLAFKAMDYLRDNSGSARLGVGISAMPSLHVAIATLGVIAAFAGGTRQWIKVLSVGFLLVILVGSVHLGWHYAVDGIASIPLTVLIWFLVDRLIDATRKGDGWRAR